MGIHYMACNTSYVVDDNVHEPISTKLVMYCIKSIHTARLARCPDYASHAAAAVIVCRASWPQ